MSSSVVSEITSRDDETDELLALTEQLADAGIRAVLVIDGRSLPLPMSAIDVLRAALTGLSDGDTVAVVREQAELTPAQAAKLLGVTRQYVDRLIENQLLPMRRLPDSRYRKVPAAAVLAYARARDAKRVGIATLVDDALDAGLDY